MLSVALQELSDLETTYWWHVGRNHIIDKQVQKISGSRSDLNILNVGSGTGGTVQVLEKSGNVINVDVSKEALEFLRKRGYKGKLLKGGALPIAEKSVDLLAALDVLEHIEDDDGALKDWLRVLKPGGAMILTVPAYQWLWSQHDVINSHYRRYVRRVLRKKLINAGFEIEKSSYAIVFSFPLVVLARFISKAKKVDIDNYSSFVGVPPFLNSFFIKLLKAEASSHQIVNYPFGTSILCICRKPVESE